MDEIKLLYGLEGAERMYLDPAEVYESEIDPDVEIGIAGSRTIYEWSVHPPIYHVPSAVDIVERLTYSIVEDGEIEEPCSDEWESRAKDPGVLAAAEALRVVLANTITSRMADKILRTLTITWGEDGEPLIDGEPLYVKKDAR